MSRTLSGCRRKRHGRRQGSGFNLAVKAKHQARSAIAALMVTGWMPDRYADGRPRAISPDDLGDCWHRLAVVVVVATLYHRARRGSLDGRQGALGVSVSFLVFFPASRLRALLQHAGT